MTLEHVTISALELAHHSVVEVRRYHQPVLGGFRQLGALGCKTKSNYREGMEGWIIISYSSSR